MIILYKMEERSEVVVSFSFIYKPIPVNTSRTAYYTDGKFDLAFQLVSERSADENREHVRGWKRERERERKRVRHIRG